MARRILTADDVAAMAAGSALSVDEATTLTSAARDLARRRGIEVVDVQAGAGATPASGADRAVPAGAAGAIEGIASSSVPIPAGDGAAGLIIVTAVGVNRPHVLAELTEAIGRLGGDIQDVSQRITGGYFNAILVVDARRSGHSFGEFRTALIELSEPSDYVVTVIDERVFRAMHRI